MPKRLSTEEVKATFERYGYTVPANFVYKNNITHYRVYDQLNNDYIDMTYKMLMYQVKNKNRQIMPADNDEDLLMNIGLHTHTHTELHEMMAAPSFHFRSVL